MKNHIKNFRFLWILILVFPLQLTAQVGINANNNNPDPSAMLDVQSTDKGMLVPRMTTAQRTAISNPTTGLLVFDNQTNSFWFWSGSQWEELGNGGGNGWGLTGNAGTDAAMNFIGTTDSVALVLKVNDQPAMRLIPGTNATYTGVPNIVGGHYSNYVPSTNISGATIAGGRANSASSNFATVSGGHDNQVNSNADGGTIGGGKDNGALGDYSTIPGGRNNFVSGDYSFAAGKGAAVFHNGSFVFADQGSFYFNSVADNEFAIRARGGVRFVTAANGVNPTQTVSIDSTGTVTAAAFVGDGSGLTNLPTNNGWSLTGNAGTDTTTNFIGTTDNMPLDFKVNGQRALRLRFDTISTNIIGGYAGNFIASGIPGATIAGGGTSGRENSITADFGFIGGGTENSVTGIYGVIGGGNENQITGAFGTMGGGIFNLTSGVYSSVGGGRSNTASGEASTVTGGRNNSASGLSSSVAGGEYNDATGEYSTVGGGRDNEATGDQSVVGGGLLNEAAGNYSTVAGGESNDATGERSMVGGGFSNDAGGNYSTVGGGDSNGCHWR